MNALWQEAFLAALSEPRQAHRVDDQLLEQAKTGEPNYASLPPEQLAKLRADRDASRRLAPVAVISSAVSAPLAVPCVSAASAMPCVRDPLAMPCVSASLAKPCVSAHSAILMALRYGRCK